MSYEWNSRNGRGRLAIYSDEIIQRFDKLSGSLDFRSENAMIVYEDRYSGTRRIIVSEEATVWEDDRYVYIRLRGRRTSRTESMSTYTPSFVPRRTQQPIRIYDP